MDCQFIVLTVSFHEQKFLILIMYNLSFFFFCYCFLCLRNIYLSPVMKLSYVLFFFQKLFFYKLQFFMLESNVI